MCRTQEAQAGKQAAEKAAVEFQEAVMAAVSAVAKAAAAAKAALGMAGPLSSRGASRCKDCPVSTRLAESHFQLQMTYTKDKMVPRVHHIHRRQSNIESFWSC